MANEIERYARYVTVSLKKFGCPEKGSFKFRFQKSSHTGFVRKFLYERRYKLYISDELTLWHCGSSAL